MARFFSRRVKNAMKLITGREGEADHKKPYSKGGETTVENCQIISRKMNNKKSDFYLKPRAWQSEFLESWLGREIDRPYLLTAIPGAGKTHAALQACLGWMWTRKERRVIIVGPTRNVAEQWRAEAHELGCDLQTKELGTKFDRFDGAAITYQYAVSNIPFLNALCSEHQVIVVFDEIHHCEESASTKKGGSVWGDALVAAFNGAEEKLLLSGTPWKTNGKRISFVRYDEVGFAISDYSYDYPRAITESVVRYLKFDYAAGAVTNELTRVTEEVSESITEEEAEARLRPLLTGDETFISAIIQDAHARLLCLRETIKDAAALVVCVDVYHATKTAEVIEKVTGCIPSVIVSDVNYENDTVRDFRDSTKEWLVSVKMVSEGTDIKRLQVLCYLTTTATELFFRQVIGRVSRFRDIDDFEGYVFLPSDPRLIRYAENIKSAQVQALEEDAETVRREMGEETRDMLSPSYSTQHNGTTLVILGDEKIPADEAERLQSAADESGLSMGQIRLALSSYEAAGGLLDKKASYPRRGETVATLTETAEERMIALRSECSKLAFRLSMSMDIHPKEVHKMYKKQGSMTEQELDAKLADLRRRYVAWKSNK